MPPNQLAAVCLDNAELAKLMLMVVAQKPGMIAIVPNQLRFPSQLLLCLLHQHQSIQRRPLFIRHPLPFIRRQLPYLRRRRLFIQHQLRFPPQLLPYLLLPRLHPLPSPNATATVVIQILPHIINAQVVWLVWL